MVSKLAGPWTDWVSTGARLALGGIWVWAGIAKVGDPAAALRAVRAYRLLPGPARTAAWGLPFAEITLGVLLLLGIRTRLGAVISLAMLAAYIGAIASAWARGLQIECGCFGGGGPASGVAWSDYLTEIVRDLGFGVFAIWLALHPQSRLSLGRQET